MSYSKLVPNKTDPRELVMRMMSVREETANDTRRSVEVVVATENPVERFDERRNTTIREVLLMSGVNFRTERKQLPIVDSHDRSTVRNILGSVRNLRVDGDSLIGDATFASDPESQMAYQKIKDGHITDFSITASPNEVRFVERGQSFQSGTQTIQGPADIVTRWQPTDASLVATGADARSTVRDSLMRSYSDANRKEIERMEMSPETIKALVSKGMPSDLTDANQIGLWMLGYMSSASAEEVGEPVAEPIMAAEPVVPAVEEVEVEDKPEEEMKMELQNEITKALEADKIRRKEIQASCKLVKIEREFADKLCDDGVSVADANKKIIERLSTPATVTSGVEGEIVRMTGSEDDKFEAAARDGLIMRTMSGAGVRTRPFTDSSKPAVGAEDFAHQSLFRMAERYVQRAHINTDRLSPKDIAMIALGHKPTMQRCRIQRDAFHVTGSFSNLMLDAANKTLRAGYEEAEYTWNIWARQGASASDLKTLNRIMFSEYPNLDMVPEAQDYPDKQMSDAKESYKPEKFGGLFSVSWETVVNDDLDAISRIPAMQGNAARRTQNAKVYEVLTSNPVMSDTYELFSTSHASGSNYQTTGAVPSVTTLNAGFLAMRTQKGLNSTVTLNLKPRYLIVPAALEATALALVASTADPAAGGSAVGNSGNANIYGPGASRTIQVVADATLDASSAAFWYLAADSRSVDTVELTFLQGEETPVLETEWDYQKDVWTYKIRQTFGVKAIDWRGLYCNDGA